MQVARWELSLILTVSPFSFSDSCFPLTGQRALASVPGPEVGVAAGEGLGQDVLVSFPNTDTVPLLAGQARLRRLPCKWPQPPPEPLGPWSGTVTILRTPQPAQDQGVDSRDGTGQSLGGEVGHGLSSLSGLHLGTCRAEGQRGLQRHTGLPRTQGEGWGAGCWAHGGQGPEDLWRTSPLCDPRDSLCLAGWPVWGGYVPLKP